MERPVLIAVDLGPESGRVSLLRWIGSTPDLQVVHRFFNIASFERKGLCWDIDLIKRNIEQGLRLCAKQSREKIAAIGIDGWAADYVRLDSQGKPLGQTFCYRDERTKDAMRDVLRRIPAERLYELTGIELLPLNTLFQLHADNRTKIPQSAPWINLPEFFLHQLGGERIAEYTNAKHTQLVQLEQSEWCAEIFQSAGLDLQAAPRIVPTGTVVGQLKGPLAELPEFRETRLIAPACHDTASAIAGIPAEGEDWAFISSGPWSRVGTVLDSPCVNEAACQKNFTNLGGVGGQVYFLKNVNGLWLFQQCIKRWALQGYPCNLDTLMNEAAALPAPDRLLDVDDPDLLLPGNMPGRINFQRVLAGYAPFPEEPEAMPAITNLIFHSLAARYAEVLADISAITRKKIRQLYIVGAGSKNALLNCYTAERTGLDVRLGAVESTTIGNFAIQLATLQGKLTKTNGVRADAIARWARILAPQSVPIAYDNLGAQLASPTLTTR